MKLLLRTTPLLLALALGACGKPQPTTSATPAAKDVTAQTTGLGEQAPAIVDASAVWTGSLDSCRTAATASEHCLIDTLRASGASPAAVAAARMLSAQGKPGHVSAWSNVEGVGVATLEFPFRANTNEGTWLVDASGKTIDVDEDLLDEAARGSTDYKSFSARHPDAAPFAPAEAVGSQALPDGGIRLRYRTPLRSCHACADEGQVTIGYDFDKQRHYLGRQLLELR